MASSSPDFWTGLRPDIRDVLTTGVGEDRLADLIKPLDASASPSDKLLHLQSLATAEVESRAQAKQDTNKTLFALALIQDERNDWPAAEKIWRQVNTNQSFSKPNLAASFNLARGLVMQAKHAEAEAILRVLTPLLQVKIGDDSPQAFGCYRNLAEAVHGQGRTAEADTLLQEAKAIIERLENAEEKQWQLKEIEKLTSRF